MVRQKHRYLLIEILYPTSNHDRQSKTAQPPPSISISSNPTLHYHRPTPSAIAPKTLIRTIRAHLQMLFGEVGAALAGGSALRIVYFSNATSTFVLRCRREAVRELWAALCFMKSLFEPEDEGGRLQGRSRAGFGGAKSSERAHADEVVLRVVRVSGTIKKSEEELIRRARDLIGKVRGVEEVVRAKGRDGGGEVLNVSGKGDGEGQTTIEGHENDYDELSEDDEQDEEMPDVTEDD